MDNLHYGYHDQSNRLRSVYDSGYAGYGFKDGNTTGSDDYTYDVNGNMAQDKNKGITSIEYNHLNLPTKVFLGQDRIEYVYDATGVKLMKSVVDISEFGSSTTTNTANTVYAGNYIYETASVSQGFNYTEVDKGLQFFNQPEGYVKYDQASASFDYVYQYKDHLNNVRLSYSDTDENGTIDAATEIIQEKNFYPFGLTHSGYNNVTTANGNATAQKKKTYQSQEFHDELGLNLHEWKYRFSDPAIGRFISIDPVAQDYAYNSTYAFAENKLGLGGELEGKELLHNEIISTIANTISTKSSTKK